MIDLHIHTNNSDGDKTVGQVLEMCEERKLEYISITDHNTCRAYESLEIKENSGIFKGKIITGCEFTTFFKGNLIEILGYNIDTKIINEWSKNYYSKEKENQSAKILFNRLLDVLDKLGVIYDKSKFKNEGIRRDIVEKNIYNEIIKHKENYSKINAEVLETSSSFFRKGLVNPNGPLFINHIEFIPNIKDIIDLINSAGGKVFFAHPFQYGFKDTTFFMDELIRENKIDGIECYHSEASKEEIELLLHYAKCNNLSVSGGSDYHGDERPNISIGVGKENLNISKDILKNWI